MTSRPDRISLAVYGALLWLLPIRFRERYSAEMRAFFRDAVRDARAQRGAVGVLTVWWHAAPDLIYTACAEHVTDFLQPPPARHRDSMPTRLLSDLRYTLRAMRRQPVFFGIALLVLALGTGAVSTIYSVANAILLRPIPGARDATRLVEVGRTRPGGGGSLSSSYPYYRALATGSRSLDGLAAWAMLSVTLSTGGQGVAGLGQAVSGNYFSVLGVSPAFGRFFAGRDDQTLADENVAVVSHAYWRRHLGGDSSVVGRPLRVNGQTFTIVAVAPPRFTGVYPALRTDLWLPLGERAALRGNQAVLDDPGASWMQLVGRLAPGRSLTQAREELSALTTRFVAGDGRAEPSGFSEFAAADVDPVAGIPADAAGTVAGFLGILMAIAALVLAIASLNVASMLLSRAAARRREMAMRVALGASRAQLVRQLLVETALLFGAGGAAGTLVAVGGTRLLQRIQLPIDVPLELQVTPDFRVLGVTLLVALVTGLAFGLAPALQGAPPDVQTVLRSDSAGSGRKRSRLRQGLIVAQVAASLLLLSSAGLFAKALGKGRSVDPGFTIDGVVTATIDLESAGYADERARAFLATLRQRLAAAPGVQAVGAGRLVPLTMSSSGIDISIGTAAPPGGRPGDPIPVSMNEVDAGYFDALRLPILRGRNFSDADGATAPRVAIVSEAFARRYFPRGDAVGASVRIDTTAVSIVGIARDAKFARLTEAAEPFLYLPVTQRWRSVYTLLVRTTTSPEATAALLLRESAALDPLLPPPSLSTLRQATAVVLLPQRVAAAVTGALGMVGLLLAAVGLYGLLAFAIAQRTREIGVRLALGASHGGIMRMVVGEGVRLVAGGAAAGLVLAAGATQALKPFLFGVDPLDPATFLVIIALLGGVALLAAMVPAMRAARVDPALTMREE